MDTLAICTCIETAVSTEDGVYMLRRLEVNLGSEVDTFGAWLGRPCGGLAEAQDIGACDAWITNSRLRGRRIVDDCEELEPRVR